MSGALLAQEGHPLSVLDAPIVIFQTKLENFCKTTGDIAA